MQAHSWDGFRFVLAVFRCETLSAASRSLAVNETTVSRRLTQIESQLQTKLFSRSPTGLEPTDAGLLLVRHIERAEAELDGGRNLVTGSDHLVTGAVRIAADPLIVNHILVPRLVELMSHHPDLEIDLIASSHLVSVARREADIAIQMSEPIADSRQLRCYLGALSSGIYASSTLVSEQKTDDLPWLTYSVAYADIPIAKWINDRVQISDGSRSRVALNCPQTLVRCLRENLGKSLLPNLLAADDKELARVESFEELPSQEFWLIYQPELREVGRIKASVKWLEECFDSTKNS